MSHSRYVLLLAKPETAAIPSSDRDPDCGDAVQRTSLHCRRHPIPREGLPARGTFGNTAPLRMQNGKAPFSLPMVDPHHGCGGGEEAIRHRASEIMPYFQLRKKPLNIKLAIQSRRGREGGIWMEREGGRERRTSMSLRQRGNAACRPNTEIHGGGGGRIRL